MELDNDLSADFNARGGYHESAPQAAYQSHEQDVREPLLEPWPEAQLSETSIDEEFLLDPKGSVFNESSQAEDPMLETLTDPSQYRDRLDCLRTDILRKCRVSVIVEHRFAQQDSTFYQAILDNVVESMRSMRAQKVLDDALLLLADAPRRSSSLVVQVVDIKICQVEDVRNILSQQREWSNASTAAAYDIVMGTLQEMGVSMDTDDESLSDTEVGDLVKLYCLTVALGLASYAGSHCHSLLSNAALAPGSPIALGRGFILRPRRLRCLDEYIGSPVWVFGTSHEEGSAFLSTSIRHFNDLWGPVIELPKRDDPQQLWAVQTEGGMLFKVRDDAPLDPNIEIAEHETLTHWVRALPPSKDPISGDFMMPIRARSGTVPLFFDKSATLLIGCHDGLDLSCSHQQQVSSVHDTCLRLNDRCTFDMTVFNQHKAFDIHYIGTHGASLVRDGMDISFNAGKLITAGFKLAWKWRPASTWKTRLLYDWSLGGMWVRHILRLRVGLQWSVCTGNAKRISMFKALVLAFPQQRPTIRELCLIAHTDDNSRYAC